MGKVPFIEVRTLAMKLFSLSQFNIMLHPNCLMIHFHMPPRKTEFKSQDFFSKQDISFPFPVFLFMISSKNKMFLSLSHSSYLWGSFSRRGKQLAIFALVYQLLKFRVSVINPIFSNQMLQTGLMQRRRIVHIIKILVLMYITQEENGV